MRVNTKHKCTNCSKCDDGECGLCCTKIENFSVTIGKTEILKDVNMHIHCGELTALIGPNGAGKSTLLKAILGELPHTGELKYLDAKGQRSGRPLIGYVPQYLNFDLSTPASVLDLFLATGSRMPAWLFSTKKARDRAYESLSKVKAAHLLNRRLGALSGGELQRVMLALALEPVPDLLLLDEPVSGVDYHGLELFYGLVSEIREKYDLSIILVSHDLDLVEEYADRIVLLNRSVVLNGTPEEVFNDERMLKTFGMSIHKDRLNKAGPQEDERGEEADA
jgi:zinc transport system ATP-binding protein